MNWHTVTVYEAGEGTETDELGNPEEVLTKLYEGEGRYTPFYNVKNALQGDGDTERIVTSGSQAIALKTAVNAVKTAKYADMDGIRYTVKSVNALEPRWTVLEVEVYHE